MDAAREEQLEAASNPNLAVSLSAMKKLAGCFYTIEAHRPLNELAETLSARPDWPGAIITRNGKRQTVISRGALDHAMSRQYYRELFYDKPIINLLRNWPYEPLQFPAETHISDVVNKALARPAEDRYEPIIAIEDDGSAFLIDLFPLLSQQCWLLTAALHDVTEQHRARVTAEAERERMHDRLVEVSRRAGMAEIATGVLHNVGNVLNSVNVSASLAMDKLRSSRIDKLQQVADLINSQPDVAAFFANDERAERLPAYITKLAGFMSDEREATMEELDNLVRSIDHIKHIVKAQQKHARINVASSQFDLIEVIEDAVRLNALSLERHQIHIKRDYEKIPRIQTDKHLVLQILVNLISNAKQAVKPNESGNRHLTLSVRTAAVNDKSGVRISIVDNGIGIAREDFDRIFSRGFTTRKDGHGFGLHNSSNHAHMMQGNISVESDGLGCGATFHLDLPLNLEQEEIAAA